MMKSTYRDYKSFSGKTRVISSLLGFIPLLLVVYLFTYNRIDLLDMTALFFVLALFCILTGFSLIRWSADQLVYLSRETADIEAGKKRDLIRINADQELNDIADNFNSIIKKLEEANKDIKEQNVQLIVYARDLSISHNNLKQAHLEIIYRLSIAAEYRDEDTAVHLKRMSNYSSVIARGVGLSERDVDLILYASPMHDVGKIGISDTILFKPGKLTDEEFEIMKTHTHIGAKILAGSNSEIIRMAKQIAELHHEKWNGKGYPYGLKGEDIPLACRITAIADVFDALTTKRTYKTAFSNESAYSILKEGKDVHFDPHLVEVFFQNLDEIVTIQQKFQEPE